MATFMMLSTLSPDGASRLVDYPDRLLEVNSEVEAMGARVIAQYALLGQYDFLTIVEAADNETVAHLSVDLASRGTVHITTLPAIPVDSLVQKLGEPKQLGHR